MRNKNQLPFDFINRENTNTLTRFKESMPQFMYVVQASGNEVIYNSDVYFRVDINNIWVDNAGKDTWEGTFRQPFQTIGRALEIANSGDTINVLPGSYSGSFALKDRVNFNFFSDANVYNSGFNPIFSATGSPVNANILGKGNFYCTADLFINPNDRSSILTSTNLANNIYFEFDECGINTNTTYPTSPSGMFLLKGDIAIEGESVWNRGNGVSGFFGDSIFRDIGEGNKIVNLQSAYCSDSFWIDDDYFSGGISSINVKYIDANRYTHIMSLGKLFAKTTTNIEIITSLSNYLTDSAMFYLNFATNCFINLGSVSQSSRNGLLHSVNSENLFFSAKEGFGKIISENNVGAESIQVQRLTYSGQYPIEIFAGNNTTIENTTVYNISNFSFSRGAFIEKDNMGVLYLKNVEFKMRNTATSCIDIGFFSYNEKDLISFNNVVSNKPLPSSFNYNGTFLEMPLPSYSYLLT
jgi:hypothetical protein